MILFQFTPLWEGLHYSPQSNFCPQFDFNSRPCGRGFRVLHLLFTTSQNSFQFTPLWEGLPATTPLTLPMLLISIHAPVGGASTYSPELGCNRSISIHAPVGGASRPESISTSSQEISIHAPVGGASGRTGRSRIWNQFQFTPLWEGLPCLAHRENCGTEFQFTPLWEGLPASICLHRCLDAYFNSRPCGRGFHVWLTGKTVVRNFNSRPCGRGFVVR